MKEKHLNTISYSVWRMLPIILLTGLVIGLLFFIVYSKFSSKGTILYIIQGILMTTGLWLGCMSIVKYLWKKFPWEHAPYRHLFLEIIFIGAYTLLFSYIIYILQKALGVKVFITNLSGEIAVTLLITYFITAIHEAIFFYYQWKYNFSKSVKLEKANLEANFETLKAQVNPHFVFNSLNSLSALVDDNKAAVSYIQHLSSFLRYNLNAVGKGLVTLREEMDMVKSFVELQKFKYGESLKLVINLPVEYNEMRLPPLTLQMLIENCIKHNVISSEMPLEIYVEAVDEELIVSNRKHPKLDVQTSGLGLKNIKERLAYYTPAALVITDDGQYFTVRLPLIKPEL